MAPLRVLFCGDVNGKVRQLVKRILSVNKANGPFDALFCVGQFFPDEEKDIEEIIELVEGKQEIPLPTYFVGDYGKTASAVLSSVKSNSTVGVDGVSVCKNLFWLKGSGIVYIEGLRVAYLAGKYSASSYRDAGGSQFNGTYHEDDVDALRAFAEEPKIVDLFLSNEWPKGILNGVSGPPELDASVIGSDPVAELAAELKPRYHISGSEGLFFSRDPYLNEGCTHVTRFVGLAAVGNEKKQKFLHALLLSPASSMDPRELGQRPTNATSSPFITSKGDVQSGPKLSASARDSEARDSEGQYWRFSAPQSKKQRTSYESTDKICYEYSFKGSCSRGNSCNFKHDSSNDKLLPKGSCFDFFTKGKCERGSECKFRHTSEDDGAKTGKICYNFQRRGSCDHGDKCRFSHSGSISPPRACWFCLSSPDVDTHLVIAVGDHCYCALAKGGLVDGHVLLLPIEHFPSTVSLSKVAMAEIHKYKSVLRRLYESQGKTMVIFERYLQLKAGTHAHLQIVPIHFSLASQLKNEFVSAAKDLGFEFQVIEPDEDQNIQEVLESHFQGGRNYFYVELPEGTILAHVLHGRDSIPMQFGREVCAKVLRIPERSDWRACKVSKDEEQLAAEKFRAAFISFE